MKKTNLLYAIFLMICITSLHAGKRTRHIEMPAHPSMIAVCAKYYKDGELGKIYARSERVYNTNRPSNKRARY